MILETLRSELTLERAKELLKLGFMPNTIYGLYPELKPKLNPIRYIDLEITEGYIIEYVNNSAIQFRKYNPEVHKNISKSMIYLTYEDAKRAHYGNVLSQILRNTDGTDVNYQSFDAKYAIVKMIDRLSIVPIYHTYDLLAFNTKEQAENFLQVHKAIICNYFDVPVHFV